MNEPVELLFTLKPKLFRFLKIICTKNELKLRCCFIACWKSCKSVAILDKIWKFRDVRTESLYVSYFNIYDQNLRGAPSRVARSKIIKKAKFGHKQFQKRPNPEKWKWKFRILQMFEMCSDLSKTGNIHKKPKMAKPFYFWETVSPFQIKFLLLR